MVRAAGERGVDLRAMARFDGTEEPVLGGGGFAWQRYDQRRLFTTARDAI